MNETYWLIWDGDCGFCRRAAARFANLDRDGVFTVVPYQAAPAPPMTPLLWIRAPRSVQLVTNRGQRLEGARAIVTALEAVGWHRSLMRVLQRRPLIWMAEIGYRLVAMNRNRLGWVFKT